MLRQWHATQGQVTFVCDGEIALNHSFDTLQYPITKLSTPDADVLQSIRSIR